MEKRDFLYHFTDIFLTEAVRETILIENWEKKKDFDPRYEEYAKFFMAMKKVYESKKLTDDELKNELMECKNMLVKNFNKTMAKHFSDEIMKRGCKREIADQLISSEGIFFEDSINVDALKTFRVLEEKI